MIKPSVYLEDYGDGFDERVSVVLLCRDAMSAGVQVRLRLTVKCQNGVTLRTKSHAVFSPITLYHGTPDRLGAAELAPYFDVRNLDVLQIQIKQLRFWGGGMMIWKPSPKK